MKKLFLYYRAIAFVLMVTGIALPSSAAAPDVPGVRPPTDGKKSAANPGRPYSPYVGKDYPVSPLFGDTHLHTWYSFDAGSFGAVLGPEEAYRFARGEEVTASNGQRVKLARPLQFLVVADHSDGLGLFPLVLSEKPDVLNDPESRRWLEMMRTTRGVEDDPLEVIIDFTINLSRKHIPPTPGTSAFRRAWDDEIDAAETFNDPGRFSTLIGYEWTAGGGDNLHRNVIFRDNADRVRQIEPFTTGKPLGSSDPVDLWQWMAAYEAKTGGRVLAIPHNGNLSNGRMFPTVGSSDTNIDRSYALSRSKWERLYEVTQIKGTGEAHPYLSPNDEFANFEIWDKGNASGGVAKTREMLQYEYAREALKNGLKLKSTLGANPYKFGLIGSTDSHNALSAVEEENFFGKFAAQEPSAQRMSKVFSTNPQSGVTVMNWEFSAAGYAAVWANENTRESIYDAMARRETYATTGSRMTVRLFGGWNFQPDDAGNPRIAALGYARGVPMGGELSAAPAGRVPTFLVAASKDPDGANLDRYQLIKGWLDGDGELHEKVYDVAWSGDRSPGADGRLPPVGSTVDVANASWTNSIGAPELMAVWKDPDFSPSQPAFYYGRVIEIPTPRWTAYDAKRFEVSPPEGATLVLQERAYTSPIWYTPAR